MDTEPITAARLAASVVAVPPLARRSDFTIDREQNSRLVKYLENDGISTLLYGGNAILYHVRMTEFADMLSLLTDIAAPNTLMANT